MKYLVNGKEMKEIDRRTIEEYGIPSLVLMERAAMAVAREAEHLLKEQGACGNRGAVWAVCGLGNNGADGVAAARMLHLKGYETLILLPKADGRKTEELELQLEIAKKLGIPVYTAEDFLPGNCRLIIDALFGIGLSREVEGPYRSLIELMKERQEIPLVAADIPSGINSDTGAVMGCAVQADVTVTFGQEKLGQTLYPGRSFCGRLVVEDLGFVPETEEMKRSHVRAHDPADLLRIPDRKARSNKGTYGRVLIVAGAKNMAGAAWLSAKAAYRAGAGLVKVLTPEENRTVIGNLIPEAILSTYCTEDAESDLEGFRQFLKEQAEWADVIVLGPGMGTENYARVVAEPILGTAYVPMILDADGLNLAARFPYLTGYFTENLILTPHLGEMARLTEKNISEIQSDLVTTAADYGERYGVTCVLKDAVTVTARKDGQIFLNQSGSPAMAKGGSGDVLTGVIAAFVAIGMEECDAASLGVYVHGLAGELAGERYGEHSVLAGELADCVGEVLSCREKKIWNGQLLGD